MHTVPGSWPIPLALERFKMSVEHITASFLKEKKKRKLFFKGHLHDSVDVSIGLLQSNMSFLRVRKSLRKDWIRTASGRTLTRESEIWFQLRLC